MFYPVLVIVIICCRQVSTDFIQGKRINHCTHEVSQDYGPKQKLLTFPAPNENSENHFSEFRNRMLFTLDVDLLSTKGSVTVCVTTRTQIRVEGDVASNDVFVYLSSYTFSFIEVRMTSSEPFNETHSLKAVEEIHFCNFMTDHSAEGSGFMYPRCFYYEAAALEYDQDDWCGTHIEEGSEKQITVQFNAPQDVVIQFGFCILSDDLDLTVEDTHLSQHITYRRSTDEHCSPSHACLYELSWICDSTCEIKIHINEGDVDVSYISVSKILQDSKETTSEVPSTKMEATKSKSPSITIDKTSRLPSASTGDLQISTRQATSIPKPKPSLSHTEVSSITTMLEKTSNKLNSPERTLSDATSRALQTSTRKLPSSKATETQLRGFGYTIAGVGGFILLLVVFILTASCLTIKQRRKSSKTDDDNCVKTGELPSSATGIVDNSVSEGTAKERTFPKLDSPEDVVYNPAYESSDIINTSKNFENQQSSSYQTRSSSGPDVREEIYNPAYETSTEFKSKDHSYYYVDIGSRKEPGSGPEESQYHYADFKAN